jgi:segregation and condensation protein A
VSEFRVQIEVFEGPLDLLLTLVRREAIDITTVALARVTDAYLQYLTTLEAVDPDGLASFVEVASTLLVIKSRALLPRPPAVAVDEDADAQALVERLRAYRQYRRTAEQLGQRERSGMRAYVRVAPLPDVAAAMVPGEVSVAALAAAFERALVEASQRAEEPPAGGPVPPHRVLLSERLADIRALLVARRRVAFGQVLIGQRRDREYIIVSFLAVLELLRRGMIRAVQEELFGEIILEMRRAGEDALWTSDALAATGLDD